MARTSPAGCRPPWRGWRRAGSTGTAPAPSATPPSTCPTTSPRPPTRSSPAAAPEIRLADLQQKAARLEARLDPEGVRARKDEARRDRRVELRREDSGAASPGRPGARPRRGAGGEGVDRRRGGPAPQRGPGRHPGPDPGDDPDRPHPPAQPLGPPRPDPNQNQNQTTTPATAAATALPRRRLRRHLRRQQRPGREPGRQPARRPGNGRRQSQPAAPDTESGLPDDPYHDDPYADGQLPGRRRASATTTSDEDEEEEEDEGRPSGFAGGPPPGSPSDRTGRKTPMPALINITDPRRDAAGLVGHARRRRNLGPDGGRHRPRPHRGRLPPPPHPMVLHRHRNRRPGHRARLRTRIPPLDPAPAQPRRPRPPPVGAARRLLSPLNAAPEPIAEGTCDHAHQEDRYTPSRKLKHLIRARTARCSAPGCGAQAITSEIDHTIPYPAGATCEDNLGPACQRHHHAKHAPGWNLQQTEPGIMRWTTPSGRAYTTHPTQYEE